MYKAEKIAATIKLIEDWNQQSQTEDIKTFSDYFYEVFHQLERSQKKEILTTILKTKGTQTTPENQSTVEFNKNALAFLEGFLDENPIEHRQLLRETDDEIRKSLAENKATTYSLEELFYIANVRRITHIGLGLQFFTRTRVSVDHAADLGYQMQSHLRACILKICHHFVKLPAQYCHLVDLQAQVTPSFLNQILSAVDLFIKETAAPIVFELPAVYDFKSQNYSTKDIRADIIPDTELYLLKEVPQFLTKYTVDCRKPFVVWGLLTGRIFTESQKPLPSHLLESRKMIIDFNAKYLEPKDAEEVIIRLNFMAQLWFKYYDGTLTKDYLEQQNKNIDNSDLLADWGFFSKDNTVRTFLKNIYSSVHTNKAINFCVTKTKKVEDTSVIGSNNSSDKNKSTAQTTTSDIKEEQKIYPTLPNQSQVPDPDMLQQLANQQAQLNKLGMDLFYAEQFRQQAELKRNHISILQTELQEAEFELIQAQMAYQQALHAPQGRSPVKSPLTHYASVRRQSVGKQSLLIDLSDEAEVVVKTPTLEKK